MLVTLTLVMPIDNGTKMVFYALELDKNRRTAKQDLRQVAFIYDPATKQLSPWEDVNNLADQAARIIGKQK